MPTYSKHNFGITIDEARRLAQGQPVKLNPAKAGAGVAVYMTHGQHTKVMNGGALRMTRHQIHHNLKHGGGIWDTIKSAATNLYHKHKGAVKTFAIAQAKKHLPVLANKALDKLAGHRYAQHPIAKLGISKAREAIGKFAGGSSRGNLGASNVPRAVGRKSQSTKKRGGSFLLA